MRVVPDFRKTRMCEMHLKHACPLSEEECAFAHSRATLKVITDVYKTAVCRHWSETGSCRSGTQCRFAHGSDEIRERSDGQALSVTSVLTASAVSSREALDDCDADFMLSLRTLLNTEDNDLKRIFANSSHASPSVIQEDQPIFEDDSVRTAANAILAQLLLLHDQKQGA